MKASSSKPNRSATKVAGLGLAILFLAAAFFVRISNLNAKFYWIDEVSSSFVITGHWPEDIEDKTDTLSGTLISIGTYQKFLEEQPNRDTQRLVADLAKRDPQHSPLYFLLSQQWAGFFGASPKSLRLISSLLSVVALPLFGWLCIELFGSITFGLLGLGVLSLAPFHILFSQQAREYGLWFTTCCLSTALLLAANRTDKKRFWIAYGFSVAASLYTFLFSLPFLCGHLLYQLSERKSVKDRRFAKYLISAICGIAAYLPWLINILMKRQMVEDLNDWSSGYLAPKIYLQSLILNFSRLFADFNLPSFTQLPFDKPAFAGSILLINLLIAVSFFVLGKGLSRSKRVLVFSSFLIPFCFLLAMDVVKGQGIHALVSRQLMPSWMAIYLAMTFMIGVGVKSKSVLHRYMASSAFIALLGFGALFSVSYLPEAHWWPLKPKSLYDDACTIHDQRADLLVITHPIEVKQFLSMSYSLRSELALLMLKDDQPIPNLGNATTIALYHPTKLILKNFETNFELQKASSRLWIGHLKKK